MHSVREVLDSFEKTRKKVILYTPDGPTPPSIVERVGAKVVHISTVEPLLSRKGCIVISAITKVIESD